MKVNYKNMIQTYRGKKDGLVYYYHPGQDCYIAREYVKPRETAHNRRIGAVTARLKALLPSEGYKNDLKMYLCLLRSHPKTEHVFYGNQWCLFTRMMWNMASGEPVSIDLTTITREFVYDNDLPCISVKRAVEAGLLVAVSGYELLTRQI